MGARTGYAESQRAVKGRRDASLAERALAGLVVFLGAFLLFWIEPLAAKALLPRFGGAAAVWSAAMVFFQVALVAGYAYAHLGRWPAFERWHAVILLAAVATLPRTLDGGAALAREPAVAILLSLATTIGLPFVTLATTTPLVQRRLVGIVSEASVYRLYAVSNFGSLLALWSFPIAIEPRLAAGEQLFLWACGFAVYAAALVVLLWTSAPLSADDGPAPARPTLGVAIDPLWIALPACGTTLLLGFTNRLCLDLAAVPFLWILPLSVYLASYVVAFASPRSYPRRICWRAGAVLAAVSTVWIELVPHPALSITAPLLLATLFALCWICHGELARLRPPPEGLTAYFLASALGGALGGMFVALAAPRLFDDYVELPLAVFWTFVLGFVAAARSENRHLGVRGVAAIAFGCAATVFLVRAPAASDARLERGFYGVLAIVDRGHGVETVRRLIQGVTRHGSQFLDHSRRRWTTTYYGESSGIGLTLTPAPTGTPRRVGLVGLGAGTLAAYAAPGDLFRFYEIDPLVIEVARRDFTFIHDSMGRVEIVASDGRLALRAETAASFDVLVLDAFSSDAVPVHLLTREAFGEYRRVLARGGVLAVHVSNRYLDLCRVVRPAAESVGLSTLDLWAPPDPARDITASRWLLLGEPPALAAIDARVTHPLRRRACRGATVAWTDDFSNLFAVLR